MREISRGVFVEGKYPGIYLGAVASGNALLLIDIPIRTEDTREWLGQLADHGRPRYLVLLDFHPDRVLGARSIDLPLLAHDITRQVVGAWPDTFKGTTHPIGAEADRVKRISGVRRAAAEVTFSEKMLVHLGEREVVLWHRPGPTAGSIWLVLDDAKVVFIGDAVTVHEPPYLGDAELEAWFEVLDELRRPRWKSYTIVSSRDGVIDPAAITAMARYLRKVETRLRRLARSGDGEDGVGDFVRPLMKEFRLSASRREQVQLRLEAGLSRLYSRRYHGSA